jgi:very-short-patch-repair endonuclease
VSDDLELREQQVRDAVATWTGQLINLDGRNLLLYYKDLKLGTLDVGLGNPVALEALLSGRTVALSTLFEEDSLAGALKRARAVRNKAREAQEERGIATLFLGVGMATWTNPHTTAVPAAPVLLREAAIVARGAAEEDFELSLTGEVDVNPTLLHMLAEQHEIKISDQDLLDLLDARDSFDPAGLFDRLVKETSAVPGFQINERHVLGNFSYAKLPMVNDLNANLEALSQHEVVAAIAGNRAAQHALRAGGGEVDPKDPDRTPPADEFLILDADSSQQYAINSVVAGQSMVVKGPPGTGKSQSIANLVATLVARGQRVLFVAEKRAAIAAVLTRLESVGLADLVLDLHDGVGGKRKVAQNLAAALQAAGTIGKPDQRELHERLVADRGRLGQHAGAMHQIREPWGVTAFDAQCELIRLQRTHGAAATTPVLLRGQQLLALDGATFRRLRDELREFANLGGIALTPQDSGWVGARITSSDQAEGALGAAHRLATSTLPATRTALHEVLAQTGLRQPDSIGAWQQTLTLLDDVSATHRALDPAVFQDPVGPLVAATGTRKWRKQNSEAPGAQAGYGQRRRLRKAAKALWRGEGKPKREQLHLALHAAALQQAQWAALAVDGGVPRLPGDLSAASGAYEQLTRELAALGAYLTHVQLPGLAESQLVHTVQALAADEGTVRKVPRLNALDASMRRAGLGPLLDELIRRRTDAQLSVAALEECYYRSILSKIGFDDPLLASFEGTHHSDIAAQYRSDDRRHIATTAERVRRAAAERLVAARDEFKDEALLVQSEAAKKSRHLPLRQLFSAAPNVMTALKPCWAMSPLVVSQLLPGDRPYFDVVVFDEASQITPADAVPSILRAHRVVVAGDNHQLPPTSFFGSSSDGEDDSSPIAEDGSINLALTQGYESILDVLGAAMCTSMLTWHYRSRDERLIGFSNAWIYDRSLTTFPGPAGSDCLQHVLVDQEGGAGQEDSTTAEVQRVVDLILEHASTRPGESLGVIAMGIKHADRIDAALRRALHDRPELHPFFDESRAEKFFVKNLERVQGDERDAIILSIGYGKTADGRLPYRFGPLLQDGGERRLNVAITRAKSRMTLVSSFSHFDMDPGRSSAEGVKMLRAYIEYAASAGTNLGSVAADKPALNPFEIDVRDRLTAAGLPLTAQWGVAGYWIDFAAAHPTQPGRMVLAIEADGATYHSSVTARDRDRLRQDQLERLGWTFHRIWSTGWFRNPDACVARAKAAYDAAVAAAEASDGAADVARATLQVDLPEQRTPAASVPETSTPSPARPRGPRPDVPAGYPIGEYSERELVKLIRWIESDTLLRTEAELLREFMNELGFLKRGSRIVAAFERAAAAARASHR